MSRSFREVQSMYLTGRSTVIYTYSLSKFISLLGGCFMSRFARRTRVGRRRVLARQTCFPILAKGYQSIVVIALGFEAKTLVIMAGEDHFRAWQQNTTGPWFLVFTPSFHLLHRLALLCHISSAVWNTASGRARDSSIKPFNLQRAVNIEQFNKCSPFSDEQTAHCIHMIITTFDSWALRSLSPRRGTFVQVYWPCRKSLSKRTFSG